MPNAQSLYVQVEVGLPHSKLIDRARVKLGVSTNEAIGLFVRLWLAVLERHTGGSLADRSNGWIEEVSGWRGEADAFASFVRDHHLDPEGRVRDWAEKYGVLESKREQERAKKARQRGSVPGTSRGPSRGQVGDMPNASASPEGQIPKMQLVAASRDGGNVPGTVPGTSRGPLITSSSSSAVSSSVPAIPKTEPVGREGDPLDRFADRLAKYGEFEPDIRALLRSAEVPESRLATLDMAVQEGAAAPVVGRAVREMVANGERFNAMRLTAFVKRLARVKDEPQAGAVAPLDAEAVLARTLDWAKAQGGYKHITADAYKRDLDPAVRHGLSACGGLKLFETADEIGLRILTKKFVQVYAQETANASA